MIKKTYFAIFTICSCFIFLVGCTKNSSPVNADTEQVKLTFMANVVGVQDEALAAAVKKFEAETGYQVEYMAPGSSYEELMKTKMSANELPDVFTTHGWSVLRYSEYLELVNEMSFAPRIVDQIKPAITDKDGNMYVLPIDVDIAGIIYNVAVVEAAGITIDEIRTWDDFYKACEKIKAAGVTPIYAGAKDPWTIGQFGDYLAPSFFVTNETDHKREELKSGIFDATKWEEISITLEQWKKAGFFNEDVLTSDYIASTKALGTGTCAFGFYGNYALMDAQSFNPDARLGMFPIPSATSDDSPTFIAGERVAVGIWKDSPHKQAAVELLEFLARPEIAEPIASASGCMAGLSDVKSEIGEVQQYFDKYKDIRTFPYFDREYLPSGMWDVMCAANADILSQKANAVSDSGKVMEQNFNDKFVK